MALSVLRWLQRDINKIKYFWIKYFILQVRVRVRVSSSSSPRFSGYVMCGNIYLAAG